ncbi:general substrate transporter [Phakopsora pachyrhizi]|uniref:General substrate transporter n=1 Tax=Phakopsora pachyrhizi TaxID=170000 RepID=A0AAV0BAE1_PHAPC|nr:general substrate transporter [Phakopsora pachyrhizi]CAH7683110.1 general substrate transporter [Phakopsora pachyrhizi]
MDPTKPYWGLTGNKLNKAVGVLSGLGFLLFGYDQGVMGGLLTLPSFVQVFPEMDTISASLTQKQKEKNSTLQGAAVALYEIGCMIGALSCAYFGDKFGRRKIIFAGSIVMLVGTAIQCTSFSLAQFIVGRIVTGFGNGFITATVPVWQSECSKAHERGKLVMLEGSLITAGIMISYWIDFAFYFVKGSSSWRLPIALQACFAVAIMSSVLSLPESPRWLMKKGMKDEARKVFAALEGKNEKDPVVEDLVQSVENSILLSGPSKALDVFKMGKSRNFHRAFLGFMSQCFQQIGGINLITYYAATVYENYLHLSPVLSRILAACTGTEFFMASWVAVYTIERFGRRKLMLFGSVGMCLSMTSLSIAAWAIQPSSGLNTTDAAIIAAVLFFVYNTFFGIGWLGMSWLYSAEIVPLEVRGAATGISTASNWIFNFLIVLITPIAFSSIGWKTYLIFAVVNFAITPSVYFFFPETTGRSLEEIDLIFAKSGWLTVVNNARPSVTPLVLDVRSEEKYYEEEKDASSSN